MNAHSAEERIQILRMLEENKLSAEQAAQLLSALDADRGPEPQAAPTAQAQPRWFHIQVTDTFTGQTRASVHLPLGLVDWGLRLGSRFAPEVSGIDLEELRQALYTGVDGKLIEVTDEEDGEQVEIFIA